MCFFLRKIFVFSHHCHSLCLIKESDIICLYLDYVIVLPQQ